MNEGAGHVESLFAAAAALPDDDARTKFLNEACADDAGLRAQLEHLLDAHARSRHWLDEPAASGLAGESTPTPADERPGTLIAGRYKLLEAIGEGGMGIVWVAEQTEPVKRNVALKLVKAGMDSRSVLARFEAERQACLLYTSPSPRDS